MNNTKSDESFFCILPWKHLMLQPGGKVYTCCEATNNDGEDNYLGNVQTQPLSEIWNSETIKRIRLQVLSGQIPNQCQGCVRLEEKGFISDRNRSNEIFKDSYSIIEKTSEKGELDISNLKSFDLRLSNICNFACRTCNPEQSSKWAIDYLLLTGKTPSSPVANRAFKDSSHFEAFSSQNLNAERFFFAGGEPLLQTEHYQILDHLIQNKKTECTLAYITNLSILNFHKKHIVDYWKQFKKIELTVSVDAIGQLGEYIRDGLNWDVFFNNIQQIKVAVPHVKMSVNITVSLLNLVEIPDTINFCLNDLAIDSEAIILTPVTSPLIYRITLLPEEAKQEVAKKLLISTENLPTSLGIQIKGIVDYMFSENESSSWKLFLTHNKRIDQVRSQSFHEVSRLFDYTKQ